MTADDYVHAKITEKHGKLKEFTEKTGNPCGGEPGLKVAICYRKNFNPVKMAETRPGLTTFYGTTPLLCLIQIISTTIFLSCDHDFSAHTTT